MNEFILSIDQMNELKDLGIDVSKASMYYSGGSSSHGKLMVKTGNKKLHPGSIPVFTLHDIIELLPKRIETNYELHLDIANTSFYYKDFEHNLVLYQNFGGPLLRSAFYTLKWVKTNKYM